MKHFNKSTNGILLSPFSNIELIKSLVGEGVESGEGVELGTFLEICSEISFCLYLDLAALKARVEDPTALPVIKEIAAVLGKIGVFVLSYFLQH